MRTRTSGGTRRRPSGEPPPLPRRLSRATIASWAAFVVWAVVWVWVFVSRRHGAWITERDLDLMGLLVEHRPACLTPSMEAVNAITLHWLTAALGWPVIVIGLATRRIRHVLLQVLSLGVTAAVATVVGVLVARQRPLGIEVIGEWEGFSQPPRPLALAATAMTAGVLSTTGQGATRQRAALAGSALLALVGSRRSTSAWRSSLPVGGS